MYDGGLGCRLHQVNRSQDGTLERCKVASDHCFSAISIYYTIDKTISSSVVPCGEAERVRSESHGHSFHEILDQIKRNIRMLEALDLGSLL